MQLPEFQLMCELGYSAALRGWFNDARIIFEALEVLAPQHAAAAVGFGLLALVQGDFAKAIDILEKEAATAKSPAKSPGGEAQAMLVLAYRLARRNADAERLQREIDLLAQR